MGSTGSPAEPGFRLLIVEDEPVLRASMARGLAKMRGVDVDVAGSVREARAAIAACPPDALITDLDLPDGTGLEVVAALEDRGIRVPLLFVSAYVQDYHGRLPRRPGVRVLDKPISLERLRQEVELSLALETGDLASPFAVAEFVQLAGLARRTVLVEIRSEGLAGQIIIRGGLPWSARDERGEGEAAFMRLVGASGGGVVCRHAEDAEIGDRQLEGSVEGLLLEAARRTDEARRPESAPAPRPGRPPPPIRTSLPRRSSATGPPAGPPDPQASGAPGDEARFAELYELGVDALLAKRHADAYRAFVEAERLRPDDSRVQANLARLREMGHGT